MATPSKPIDLTTGHRTKAEIQHRKEQEEALFSGKTIEMRSTVKKNSYAKKEFNRVVELLQSINKNDAIYESVINRYCIIQAECDSLEKAKSALEKDIAEITKDKEKLISEGLSLEQYYTLKAGIKSNFVALDTQINKKRNMLLAIEKESLFTLAAALRSIQKTPPKEEKKNKFENFFGKEN